MIHTVDTLDDFFLNGIKPAFKSKQDKKISATVLIFNDFGSKIGDF